MCFSLCVHSLIFFHHIPCILPPSLFPQYILDGWTGVSIQRHPWIIAPDKEKIWNNFRYSTLELHENRGLHCRSDNIYIYRMDQWDAAATKQGLVLNSTPAETQTSRHGVSLNKDGDQTLFPRETPDKCACADSPSPDKYLIQIDLSANPRVHFGRAEDCQYSHSLKVRTGPNSVHR